MEIKEIQKLYNKRFATAPGRVTKMPGAGSSRLYYLIEKGEDAGPDVPQKVVATIGRDIAENRAFCDLGVGFGMLVPDVTVPRIYAESADGRCYLQSWHGGLSLMDLIDDWHRKERALEAMAPEDSAMDAAEVQAKEAYQRMKKGVMASIDALVSMQTTTRFDYQASGFQRPFGRRQILWDLNYFKYEFLKPAGLEFNEDELEDDFERLAMNAERSWHDSTGFMYRDFQSRNILVDAGKPVFIDFQGGRRGPMAYDIISFLWQAKAGFSEGFREEIFSHYNKEVEKACGRRAADSIRESFAMLLPLRLLQVLGAYGFRGLVERKSHFIESIPAALDNLEKCIADEYLEDYPELKRCCRGLVALKSRFQPSGSRRLTVSVFSFSYKKGYPDDFSGNGGGFMFDCRGMHNPGRYEEYRNLTGRDLPVIKFLEERGEVQGFLEAASRLVDAAVECYLRRGFSNLQVGFGCTGGQHRSVYCAQHLAERLAAKYPDAQIRLEHREQGVAERYNFKEY